MFDLSWMLGRVKIFYTSHNNPVPLKTKSGQETTLLEIARSSIPACRLNPFLFNGHLQTIYTAFETVGPLIYYKRKILDSNHSVYPGQFAVDFVVSKEKGENTQHGNEDHALPNRTTTFSLSEWSEVGREDDQPMIIALHGLTGGSHEVYLREAIAPLVAAGWAACVVNGRGCAKSKITTPQLFNPRATWDVRQTITLLHSLFPNRPLYAVGFSLGANILTNYCAEEGGACVLRAAVACSNPWNLEICHNELQRTWVGREIYCRALGKNIMTLFDQHKEQILKNPSIDLAAVLNCKYLHEFDRQLQCPTWGYPTVGAYYRDVQSVDALLGVRIPFLGINAEDDPHLPADIDCKISSKFAIPFEECMQNPHTVLCTTNWGGHLGSFQLDGKRWIAVAASEFLSRLHAETSINPASFGPQEVDPGSWARGFPKFEPNNRKLILPES
ncbi:medium-chain fatty acid ethyl ester synthase/esteras-like protein 1 [Pyrenochaeta sp. DS3sAY3a]|nr:medium-chain fatty acid ethyl ester synthase/esteras-like protein 1 [Pyrenochaeta sp. DS3sAY3a]